MENFLRPLQIRWSDLDPNFHLRHSVYYDWGALCRIEFLYQFGLTTDIMAQLNFGPILFREECVFKKELKMGDEVTIDLQLLKAKKDFSRWTILHTIKKNTSQISALLTVDGAWLNTIQRKLTVPPDEGKRVFAEMPNHESFQWID
jgi:acyl-CoA thioester hydrolase